VLYDETSAVDRRTFLQIAAASPLLASEPAIPNYRIVSRYPKPAHPAMPGPYRGHAVRVRSAHSIDAASGVENASVVRQMLSAGVRALTRETKDRDAWSHFISSSDIVGIKVNCSGAPNIMSSPEVVAGIVENVMAAGVPAPHIYVYERFLGQLRSVHYDRHVAPGVNIQAVETSRGSIAGYDPDTYVEADFFGEDDTRSNMVRLVSQTFTKIINVPNMKEHQAAGVTGCLKNIAYGNFSNVSRSHRDSVSNTYSFIGTLASVEPIPAKTVLNVMDGLRGVWHGGPFSYDPKFRFYPKQILFGTDPVALDRLLIDVIEEKRKQEHAPSIFDRSPAHIRESGGLDPNFNHFVREPRHIEYASKLGLGVYDLARIQLKEIDL